MSPELGGKRLELLREVVPRLSRVAFKPPQSSVTAFSMIRGQTKERKPFPRKGKCTQEEPTKFKAFINLKAKGGADPELRPRQPVRVLTSNRLAG
jgi:hypothetical protein